MGSMMAQPVATTASLPGQPMQQPMAMAAPPVAQPQQTMPTGWVPGVARPIMTSVAAPPVVGGLSQAPIQYGPSYNMSYYPRSTADKTAVKYTGFLPLEGVFEEDTCRIG